MNGKSSFKTSAATTKEVDTGSRSSTGKNKPLKGPNNFIEDIFLWGYTPPGNLKAFEKIKRGDKIVLLPAFARIDPAEDPFCGTFIKSWRQRHSFAKAGDIV